MQIKDQAKKIDQVDQFKKKKTLKSLTDINANLKMFIVFYSKI